MKKSLIGTVGIACLVLTNCGEQEVSEKFVDSAESTIAEVNEVLPIQKSEEVFIEAKEEASDVIQSLNNSAFCYVGDFNAKDADVSKGGMRSNRITIQFDSIIGDSLVYGRSIVAGNFRPFSGGCFFNSKIGALVIDVEEPGDDKYDGTFSMELKDSILSGQWYSFDEKLPVNQREFNLKIAKFNYNPEFIVEADWIPLNDHGMTKPDKYIDEETGEVEYYDELVETLTEFSSINASIKELKKEDVENLYKTDLEIIRNAIYARHGYSFKNRKIRNIFDEYVGWYIPFSIDVSNDLTTLEKKNIELIKRYEKHAEIYYDAFGR